MPSQVETIKDAIKTILGTVSGLNADTIHARERRPIGEAADTIASEFVANGVVNAWEIAFRGYASEGYHTSQEVTGRFELMGWYQFDDSEATSDAFDRILEGVQDAINRKPTLDGTVRRHLTLQGRRIGLARKAGEVCHVAICELTCSWWREPGEAAGFLPSLTGPDVFVLDPSVSNLWQDAARTTPATADGDPVGAVQDARGRAIYLTAASDAARFTLRLGANGIGGRAALEGNGGSRLTGAMPAIGAPLTVSVVAAIEHGSGQRPLAGVVDPDGQAAVWIARTGSTSNGRVTKSDGSADNISVATSLAEHEPAVIDWEVDAAFPRTLCLAGVPVVADNSEAPVGTNLAQVEIGKVGDATANNALYGALILRAATLGSAERAANAAALASWFGIT